METISSRLCIKVLFSVCRRLSTNSNVNPSILDAQSNYSSHPFTPILIQLRRYKTLWASVPLENWEPPPVSLFLTVNYHVKVFFQWYPQHFPTQNIKVSFIIWFDWIISPSILRNKVFFVLFFSTGLCPHHVTAKFLSVKTKTWLTFLLLSGANAIL